MKKWIIVLIAVPLLAIGGIYTFIPSRLSITASGILNATAGGSFRTLSDKNKWDKWFPAAAVENKYNISKVLVYTVYANILNEDKNISSIIQILPISTDTTGIQWKCELTAGNNPFKRIQSYRKAVSLKNEMDAILNSFASYVSKPVNVYNFPIDITTFTDTLLLTTKTTINQYPTNAQTYEQINLVKSKIARENAAITGYPLANVTKLDSNKFQLMVALPVNRVLQDNPPFLFRRMIPAAFIRMEAKGGPQTVIAASHQMQMYFTDYRKTLMAIPFEYHVTDRMAEPDSSKWITRIYAPFF